MKAAVVVGSLRYSMEVVAVGSLDCRPGNLVDKAEMEIQIQE